jgi:signal transduction histidine kinase/CheY-like chemotaxis protein
VTINFTRMIENMGRRSPNLYYFLADSKGTWIAHPDPEQVGKPGWPAWQRAGDDGPVTLDHLDLGELGRSRGVMLAPQRLPDLRAYYVRKRLEPTGRFVRDNWRSLEQELAELAKEDPTFRFGPLNVTSMELELACADRELLQRAQDLVQKREKAAVGTSPPWTSTVECEHYVGHLMPFWQRADQTDEPLALIVAQSVEEITSDIRSATRSVRLHWGPAIVLGGCVLALAAAAWLTRPLKRIRTAAQRLAAGDYNVDLPVHGLGEVGELARSFRAMIETVRARDHDLRQLNEELEQRVRLRTIELQEAMTRLEAALDETQQANAAKDRLISTVSHELRTPLTSAIGYTQLLLNPKAVKLRENPGPTLEKILTASKHLLALVNDLLDVGRYTSGRIITLEPSTFELAPFLAGVVEMTAPLVKKNSNTLQTDIAGNLGSIRTDETRLRQILLNLLSNACKFTDNGTITFSARRETDVYSRDWLVFAVADTGVGMSPEDMQNLFKPFYRVDNSATRKQGGAGLGLSITRAVAEIMGGSVTVQSAPGVGSTFTVRVPAQPSETPAVAAGGAAPTPAQVGAPATARPLSSHLVLVIDDDPLVRQLLETYFKDQGFQVATAAQGMDGLRLARELRPATITLDVLMPGMDGWSTLAALKSDPATHDIPVVMLTIVDDRAHGFALGAADYLTKPINWDRLGTIVSRYCQPAATVLIVEDDALQRDCLRERLELLGWRVAQASNGKEGLRQLREHRPALILLDLTMPEMDGFEFLDAMRGQADLAGVPVVVVTAKDLTEEEQAKLSGCVAGVIGKGGTSREEILANVCARLRSLS